MRSHKILVMFNYKLNGALYTEYFRARSFREARKKAPQKVPANGILQHAWAVNTAGKRERLYILILGDPRTTEPCRELDEVSRSMISSNVVQLPDVSVPVQASDDKAAEVSRASVAFSTISSSDYKKERANV